MILDYRLCPTCQRSRRSTGYVQLVELPDGRIGHRPAPPWPPHQANFDDLSVVTCPDPAHLEARQV